MRNVVLICLDTVRKDYFDQFAPRLQERADTVYHQARAASAWSIPSHASMFTGELPHVHGVHTHDRRYDKLDRDETFLGALPDHTHIGVSANAYASSAYGFDTLFDVFTEVSRDNLRFEDALDPRDVDLSDGGYGQYLLASLRHEKPVQSLINGLLTKVNPYEFLFSKRPWAERKDNGTKRVLSKAASGIQTHESDGRPIFAFLNLMEAHPPMYHHQDYNRDFHSVPNIWTSQNGPVAYDISHNTDEYTKFLDNWSSLYAASIDYLDRYVVKWIDAIQESTDNETTIVITSDHGHNLGTNEDGYMFGHHTSLREGVLHIPLLVVNPPDEYPSKSWSLVSHLELGELLTSLANERVFPFSGSPVAAEVIGHTGYFSIASDLTYWDRLIRCVYDADSKTTWDSLGTTRHYELDAEKPCRQRLMETSETRPSADLELFESGIYETKRDAVWQDWKEDSKSIDDETRQRLAELGYM